MSSLHHHQTCLWLKGTALSCGSRLLMEFHGHMHHVIHCLIMTVCRDLSEA